MAKRHMAQFMRDDRGQFLGRHCPVAMPVQKPLRQEDAPVRRSVAQGSSTIHTDMPRLVYMWPVRSLVCSLDTW